MTQIRAEDAEFQLLEALRHNRRKREQRGEFLVEGVQAIDRAPRRRLAGAGRARARRRASGRAGRDGDHRTGRRASSRCRPDLFARLTDRDEPPELLLVARIPAPDLAATCRARPTASSCVVDRPAEPGQPRHDHPHRRRPRRRRRAHHRPRRPPLRPADRSGPASARSSPSRSCRWRANQALVDWLDGVAGATHRSPSTPPTRTATSCSTAGRRPDPSRRSSCSAPSAPGCRAALRDLADATARHPDGGLRQLASTWPSPTGSSSTALMSTVTPHG